MQRQVTTFVAVAALSGLAVPAIAQTTYSSRTTFNAATQNRTVQTFDEGGNSDNIFFVTSPRSYGALTFSADSLAIVASGYSGSNAGGVFGSSYLSWDSTSGPSLLTVTLPRAYNGVGFDLREGVGNSVSYTVTINGVGYSVPVGGGSTFFGYTSPTAFSSLTISLPDNLGGVPISPALNDFTFADNAPEPAAWALMIGGFALAGAAARRRRCKTAAQIG